MSANLQGWQEKKAVGIGATFLPPPPAAATWLSMPEKTSLLAERLFTKG